MKRTNHKRRQTDDRMLFDFADDGAEFLRGATGATEEDDSYRIDVSRLAETDDTFDILATVGAGDIDTLVPQLKLILTKRWE